MGLAQLKRRARSDNILTPGNTLETGPVNKRECSCKFRRVHTKTKEEPPQIVHFCCVCDTDFNKS